MLFFEWVVLMSHPVLYFLVQSVACTLLMSYFWLDLAHLEPPKSYLVPGLILSLQNYKFSHLSLESEAGSENCDLVWLEYQFRPIIHSIIHFFLFVKNPLFVDSYMTPEKLHSQQHLKEFSWDMRCIHKQAAVFRDVYISITIPKFGSVLNDGWEPTALSQSVNTMAMDYKKNKKKQTYCWEEGRNVTKLHVWNWQKISRWSGGAKKRCADIFRTRDERFAHLTR